MNKNIDGIKLIKLLLYDSITPKLFAPSACGLIQSLLQTRVKNHWVTLCIC